MPKNKKKSTSINKKTQSTETTYKSITQSLSSTQTKSTTTQTEGTRDNTLNEELALLQTTVECMETIIRSRMRDLKKLWAKIKKDDFVEYIRGGTERSELSGWETYFDLFSTGIHFNDNTVECCYKPVLQDWSWKECPENANIFRTQFCQQSGISEERFRELDYDYLRMNSHCIIHKLFLDALLQNQTGENAIPHTFLIEELITTLNKKRVCKFLDDVTTAVNGVVDHSQNGTGTRNGKGKIMVTCTSPNKVTVLATRSITSKKLGTAIKAQISYDIAVVDKSISYQNIHTKVMFPVESLVLANMSSEYWNDNAADGYSVQRDPSDSQKRIMVLDAQLKGGTLTAQSMLDETPQREPITAVSTRGRNVRIPAEHSLATQAGSANHLITEATSTASSTGNPTLPPQSTATQTTGSINKNPQNLTIADQAYTISSSSRATPIRPIAASTVQVAGRNHQYRTEAAPTSATLPTNATSTPVPNARSSTTPSQTSTTSTTRISNAEASVVHPEATTRQRTCTTEYDKNVEGENTSEELASGGTIWDKIRNFFVAIFRCIKRFFSSNNPCCTGATEENDKKYSLNSDRKSTDASGISVSQHTDRQNVTQVRSNTCGTAPEVTAPAQFPSSCTASLSVHAVQALQDLTASK